MTDNATNTIPECFQTILHGNKEESRRAARQITKSLYSGSSQKTYHDVRNQINNAPKDYRQITEDWRQENFATSISVIYFLRYYKTPPDFLFPWLLDELLQHKKGAIRYAAVRMLKRELGPLTVHIRDPDNEYAKIRCLDPEDADVILSSLYSYLYDLAWRLQEPKHKKYEYISSIPSSPYKSVQMVLSALVEDCGPEYIDRLNRRYR